MAKKQMQTKTTTAPKRATKDQTSAAPPAKTEQAAPVAKVEAAKVVKVPEARHAPTTAKLVWKVAQNCKRPGSASHARAALYWGKGTVADYLAAGATRADLSWDADHGFFDLKV